MGTSHYVCFKWSLQSAGITISGSLIIFSVPLRAQQKHHEFQFEQKIDGKYLDKVKRREEKKKMSHRLFPISKCALNYNMAMNMKKTIHTNPKLLGYYIVR